MGLHNCAWLSFLSQSASESTQTILTGFAVTNKLTGKLMQEERTRIEHGLHIT